jgi:hypothetical protein
MPPEADISPADDGAAAFENIPQDVSVDLDLSGSEMPEYDTVGAGVDFPEFGVDSELPEQNIVVPSLNETEITDHDDQPTMPDDAPLNNMSDISTANEEDTDYAADSMELQDIQAAVKPVEVIQPPVQAVKPAPSVKPVEAVKHPAPMPAAKPMPKIPAPAPAALAAESQQNDQDDTINSASFKKDLQVVLSYMDRLLEALPDEKIEEFARSKQFDVYKKVFKELGLV